MQNVCSIKQSNETQTNLKIEALKKAVQIIKIRGTISIRITIHGKLEMIHLDLIESERNQAIYLFKIDIEEEGLLGVGDLNNQNLHWRSHLGSKAWCWIDFRVLEN